jgi:hypothetical protein
MPAVDIRGAGRRALISDHLLVTTGTDGWGVVVRACTR